MEASAQVFLVSGDEFILTFTSFTPGGYLKNMYYNYAWRNMYRDGAILLTNIYIFKLKNKEAKLQ